MNRTLQAARTAVMLMTLAMTCAAEAAPAASPAARSELAPGGKLRVGLLVTNATYVTRDGTAEEMQGLSVDLARELARRLGVAFEPVRYNSPAAMLDGLKAQAWDVAFVGYAPAREAHMDFAGVYAEAGNTYIVRADSQIRTVSDADRKGNRIGAVARSVQDAYITKNLRLAEVVRPASTLEGLDLLAAGKIHAYVGPHMSLGGWAAKRPEFRLAEGTLFGIGQALAVAKGRPAGTAYAQTFIEDAKSSGFVKQAIERAQLRGVTVAPSAR